MPRVRILSEDIQEELEEDAAWRHLVDLHRSLFPREDADRILRILRVPETYLTATTVVTPRTDPTQA